MVIINQSKGKKLVSQAGVARSFFQKTKGFMFSKPEPDKGLIFWFTTMRKRSIHTFFVNAPIDVLYLDESWKIVEMVTAMQPSSLYRPTEHAQFVVELPVGSIKQGKCELGDFIVFSEETDVELGL